MTKIQIVDKIKQKVPVVSKRNIALIIDSFFEEIKQGMAENAHIELRGFGTFTTKLRKARKARNPMTGDIVDVEEHRVPYFKPGKELNLMVNHRLKKLNNS